MSRMKNAADLLREEATQAAARGDRTLAARLLDGAERAQREIDAEALRATALGEPEDEAA